MKLIYRQHALQRMFERGITDADIRQALTIGLVIARYPEDTPYPSCLWLGKDTQGKPLHIVFADNTAECERIIITVYRPDPAQWTDNYTQRKRT